MANSFIVEYTEDGVRKRTGADIGNFDGNVKEAQAVCERILGPANPHWRDIKVVGLAGAGRVDKVPLTAGPSSPEGDAALIAKGLKRVGDA